MDKMVFNVVGNAVGLYSFCKEVLKYIDEVKHIDERIQVLCIEVGSLSQVLKTFTERTNDDSLDGYRTGHEGQHWQNVARSMEDCQKTLERLTGIIEKITSKESGILRRSILVWNVNNKAEDIALCRQQVAAYRQTMQLSLQLITLYVS
jgi:Fungal N-terminal domain of STAND proteins